MKKNFYGDATPHIITRSRRFGQTQAGRLGAPGSDIEFLTVEDKNR